MSLSFAVSENEIFELNETLDRGNNSGQQTPGAKEVERNPAIYFIFIIHSVSHCLITLLTSIYY